MTNIVTLRWEWGWGCCGQSNLVAKNSVKVQYTYMPSSPWSLLPFILAVLDYSSGEDNEICGFLVNLYN